MSRRPIAEFPIAQSTVPIPQFLIYRP